MSSITLSQIYQIARQQGLDDEGARAAVAVAKTEGALNGKIGDNGQSFGPFQFYSKGMLPSFASVLGVSKQRAADIAQQDPAVAAKWALGNYLGDAIKQGQQQGLSGSELATYAQATGQRSENAEAAGRNYTQLFGQGDSTITDVTNAQYQQDTTSVPGVPVEVTTERSTNWRAVQIQAWLDAMTDTNVNWYQVFAADDQS